MVKPTGRKSQFGVERNHLGDCRAGAQRDYSPIGMPADQTQSSLQQISCGLLGFCLVWASITQSSCFDHVRLVCLVKQSESSLSGLSWNLLLQPELLTRIFHSHLFTHRGTGCHNFRPLSIFKFWFRGLRLGKWLNKLIELKYYTDIPFGGSAREIRNSLMFQFCSDI